MFATDGDRFMFLRLLREACAARSVAVHGYVLMPNHVHLLATEASRGGLSRMVQDVGRKYVPLVNERWGRCGSLWQARFRSIPVESNEYALNVLVYIDDNPVRANLVADAAAFPWSSHRCNAFGQEDPLIAPHPTYLRLGDSPEARQAAYRSRFATRLGSAQLERIRTAIRRGEPLGDEGFLEALSAQTGQRVLRRRTGRPRKWTPETRKLIEKLFEEKVGSDPGFEKNGV